MGIFKQGLRWFSLAFVNLVGVATASAQPEGSLVHPQANPAPKLALVYRGKGACKDCSASAVARAWELGMSVRWVESADDVAKVFSGASTWIQPGGLALDAAKEMPAALKEGVRNFVRNGGGFVGFCAGAFLASDLMHIDGEDVPGFGMIPSSTSVWDGTLLDSTVLPLLWNGRIRDLVWYWGPVFDVAPDAVKVGDFEILSRYSDGRPVTLRGRYGRGKVFVTGVHPESPPDWRLDKAQIDRDGVDWDLARDMITWTLP